MLLKGDWTAGGNGTTADENGTAVTDTYGRRKVCDMD